MTFESEIKLHYYCLRLKNIFFPKDISEYCLTLMECQLRNGYATHRICILMKEQRPDVQPLVSPCIQRENRGKFY